jgi:hypothetical protein
MKVRAKSASMTTDGDRFQEIFRKHSAIPHSEPIETVTDPVTGRRRVDAHSTRKPELFAAKP